MVTAVSVHNQVREIRELDNVRAVNELLHTRDAREITLLPM